MAKKKRKSSLPIICDDLMIEILSWLPVKSLMRFKCVSKSFHSLISNSDFVKYHLQRSPKNVSMMSWSSTVTSKGVFRKSYSMALLDNNTSPIIAEDQYHRIELKRQERFLLSCNGLICFVCEDHIRYWVCLWNPATGLTSQEWPCLQHYYVNSVLGFGYDVSSDTYKVVAFFHNSTKTHVKVCGLGDNCWRSIESFPALPNLREGGVYLSSTLNWLGDPNFGFFLNINQIVIVSLDLGKETFRQFIAAS
ncbi:F-box/kelch-repeat protein At3g23880-like [Gastrolobium bilobum]|uniref:F-box/kelch-repeat protein At3g23880-like n=1 Tax=Gastrolobium bilobum TaxID=150636 RepID=UPI002AB11753|nr:F-box/kelch-repeat protein At3g23880-like [Gastrolobium bilobum]